MLIHEHPQNGIDDMLGRHGLATFEVEGLISLLLPYGQSAADGQSNG